MAEAPMTALDEIRALVRARAAIDAELQATTERALNEGLNRSGVALALGISRASLYRQFGISELAPKVGVDGGTAPGSEGVAAPDSDPCLSHGLSA